MLLKRKVVSRWRVQTEGLLPAHHFHFIIEVT
jgi:hypothetical protein